MTRLTRRGKAKQPKRLSWAKIQTQKRKLLALKKRAVGYIKVGWNNALNVFGRKTRPPSQRSKAAQGTGKKAAHGDLTAWATNTARNLEYGEQALAAAFKAETIDMLQYIAKKLEKAWRAKR